MPKPIELALSQIWNRKSIECLNATQLGAFISLARANLIHGIDPLPSDRDSLQRLSRTSRIQWAKYVDPIVEALTDALPVLRASYEHQEQVSVNRQAGIKVTLAKRRQAKAKPETNVIHVPVSFADADQYAVGQIQPHIAATYLPQDYDRQARKAAITARNSGVKPDLAD